MSLETAQKKAKRIYDIVQYFNTHERLLDDTGSIVVKEGTFRDRCDICCLSFYDVNGSLSEVDLNSNYINYIKDKEHYYTSKDNNENLFLSLLDYNDCSTEENYFQKSTVFKQEVLEVLVLIELLHKNNIPDFYLDLDKLKYLEGLMKD